MDRHDNDDPVPAPWAYWDWDFVSDTLTWDENVERVTGWPAPEVSGTPVRWLRLVHPDDRGRLIHDLARSRSAAAPWVLDYRVQRKDGEFMPVRERGTVIRTGDRVTRACGSLAHVDAALQHAASPAAPSGEGEEHFRTVVDSLPQLAWSATPDGWINWYNRRWYDYTGTDLSHMEGWGWVSVHDPDDVMRVLRVARWAFATGAPWEDMVRLRRGSDGMLRWHLSRAIPIKDDRGRIVRWFGTSTDIHDQKLADEAQSRLLAAEQRARREAEAASQVKDQLLAHVSHALRTPLNAILGWTQLMALDPGRFDSRGEWNKAINQIDANARLQERLLEDMFDLSRLMTGEMRLELSPMALEPIVQAALDELRAEIERQNIAVSFPGAGRTLVQGHAVRLQQIVRTLLESAIALSRPADLITVAVAHNNQARAAVAVQTAREATERGSLGLSLAVVRQLAELHHGELNVVSAGGGSGATFMVQLPLLSPAEAADLRLATNEPKSIVALPGIRVLVVDDEPSAREVVGEILLAAGATVTKVSWVHEALRAIRLSRPDVVISDIAMPALDGYAFIERVRAAVDPETARTPCIALTAYASKADRDRALAQGFDRFLAKPVDAALLTRQVAELVRGRLTP